MKHQKGEMVSFSLQNHQVAERSADSGNGGGREGAGAQLSLAGYEGPETEMEAGRIPSTAVPWGQLHWR